MIICRLPLSLDIHLFRTQVNVLQISVNEASAQLCWHRPGLLTRREELFPLARDVVRASGYQYAKGHSRYVLGPHPLTSALEADHIVHENTRVCTATLHGDPQCCPAPVLTTQRHTSNRPFVLGLTTTNFTPTPPTSFVSLLCVFGLSFATILPKSTNIIRSIADDYPVHET